MLIEVFESAEQRYKVDAVVVKLIKDMQHPFFSLESEVEGEAKCRVANKTINGASQRELIVRPSWGE